MNQENQGGKRKGGDRAANMEVKAKAVGGESDGCAVNTTRNMLGVVVSVMRHVYRQEGISGRFPK